MSVSLAERSAVVVGAGGLGGPVLLTLGAAGVGRVRVVDADAVETSNLSGQPLFCEADLGERKAVAATRRLARRFPGTAFEPIDARFDPATEVDLLRAADVVVDASDGVDTRFLANDAAVRAGRPLVHGAVLAYSAQILTVLPGQTACLRCLFEEPPPPGTVPRGAEVGALGPLKGFVGSLMGAEAIRVLSGERGSYAGWLVVYESRSARSRSVTVRRRVGCPACGGLAVTAAPATAATAPGA